MANVPVTFAPGEPLEHLGVLVTSDAPRVLGRGLAIEVTGTALRRGIVDVTRARARPWSARLAPWQACGWEHGLERIDAITWRTVLRDAVAQPRVHGPETARQLLALAVWVQIEGRPFDPAQGH